MKQSEVIKRIAKNWDKAREKNRICNRLPVRVHSERTVCRQINTFLPEFTDYFTIKI
jgi:hypothetical protein